MAACISSRGSFLVQKSSWKLITTFAVMLLADKVVNKLKQKHNFLSVHWALLYGSEYVGMISTVVIGLSLWAGIQANLHMAIIMDFTSSKFTVSCESNPAFFKQCAVLWLDGWSRESMVKVNLCFCVQTAFISYWTAIRFFWLVNFFYQELIAYCYSCCFSSSASCSFSFSGDNLQNA